MIITVTINPAVDKSYFVSRFQTGTLNRARSILYNAGSKGINVSRVLTVLGEETCALGFVGGMNGDILLTELANEGIKEDLVRVQANTRMNVKIVDEHSSVVTEVNERGEMVSEAELAAFTKAYCAHLESARAVVISGSLLPGMPDRFYYDLIVLAKKAGKPVFVDCGGVPLYEACKASPDCIKPNEIEFAQMLGKQQLSREEILTNARELIARYQISCVVVTLGSEGAIAVTANEAYQTTPPNVHVLSTVGAGDAFLSGLCHGWLKQFDLKAQLITATSFASAKISKEGNNMPSMIELFAYTEGCRVTKLT